jgi:hypothetical protein
MSKKIEAFWENATAKDIERVMAGETVEARFRDIETDPWCGPRDLTGVKAVGDNKLRWFTLTSSWRFCQVYREPSWWTKRPDPGPGFRLLGKFPDEELKLGDECFGLSGVWGPSCQTKPGGHQVFGIWYRRRIESVEPKFAVGQTVKVVGPKEIPALEWSSVGMAQYAGTTHTVKRIELLTNPPGIYYHLGEIDNWAFGEDYLEPVEPVEKKPVLIRRWTVDPGDEIKLPNGRLLIIKQDGFEVTQ